MRLPASWEIGFSLRKSPLSVRSLRWLLLIGLLGTCGGLALVAVPERKTVQVSAPRGTSLLSLRDFHTVLSAGSQQLRISGNSLTISPLKLLGPFRLGVLHSMSARAVTVEIFSDTTAPSQPQGQSQSFGRLLTSLKPSLD